MGDSHAAIVGLLLLALVAANLPFASERLPLVGPRRASKPFGWRLLEWLLLALLIGAVGTWIEARVGRRHPQGWEFYAAGLCLFATFAFPGFVWRMLRRRGGGATDE